MNKKLLLILFCGWAFCPLLIFAKQVTVATAQAVAKSILSDCYHQSSTDYYHLFITKGDNGWALISANDVIEPVIAYSEESVLDLNTIPPAFEWILEGVKNEIERKVSENFIPSEETSKQWDNPAGLKNLRNSTVVKPLVTTGWNQDTPYNDLCPMDPLGTGQRSLTGCVATAYAQIMNFHKYPDAGKESIPAYTTPFRLDIPEIEMGQMVYTWNTGEVHPVTLEEKEEVAKLMYHVGASLQMNYRSTSSGANSNTGIQALTQYFDYDPGMRAKSKLYYDDSEWKSILKKELDEGRPVIYSGFPSGGSGHTFVCDGYNEKDFFHFNWGWGSINANSYVNFNNIEYNTSVSAVIGIQPNKDTPLSYEFHIYHYMNYILGLLSEKEEVATGENFNVEYCLHNTGTKSFQGKHGAVLLAEDSDNAEIIAVLGYNDNISLGNSQMMSLVDKRDFECVVPADVPSGNYWIQAAVLPDDSEKWIFAEAAYDKVNRLPLKVNNPDMPYLEKVLNTDKTWYIEVGDLLNAEEECYTYSALRSYKVNGGMQRLNNEKWYYPILLSIEPEKEGDDPQSIPAGYLREEYGKIYAYDEKQTEKEYLLYDFTLQEGDEFILSLSSATTPEENTLLVEKIEEVEYNGTVRKKIVFEDGSAWIEGLGSTLGILYPHSYEHTGLFALKACELDNKMVYYNSEPEYCIRNASPVFPESDAIWNIQQFHRPMDGPAVDPNNYPVFLTENQYGLTGDTIMNDRKYHKFYLLNDTIFDTNGKDVFLGGFRQKNSKVWCYLNESEEEFMLYDFSKKVGESVVWKKTPVFACFDPYLENRNLNDRESSVYISGIEEASYGRIFYLNESKDYFWIEGIGSREGLFTDFFTYPTNFHSYGYNLACFKRGDEIVYLDNRHETCTACFTPEVNMRVQDLQSNTPSISLLWNKEINAIEIYKHGDAVLSSFDLMNTQGQVVLNRKITDDNNQQIYVSGLAKGLYIYRVNDADGRIQSGKIIIN